MQTTYYVVNEQGQVVEEFDTMREAEEYVEYTSRWGHDYDIQLK